MPRGFASGDYDALEARGVKTPSAFGQRQVGGGHAELLKRLWGDQP